MTDPTTLLLCLFGLQLKHFLADFCLQTPFMLRNKGKYGHPGGLYHAAIHVLLTIPVLFWLAPKGTPIFLIAGAEFLVHYHVDWLKEKLGDRIQSKFEDRSYWMLLGADQLMHQFTLMTMIWVAFAF